MNVFKVFNFFLYDFKVPRESQTSCWKANFSAVLMRYPTVNCEFKVT